MLYSHDMRSPALSLESLCLCLHRMSSVPRYSSVLLKQNSEAAELCSGAEQRNAVCGCSRTACGSCSCPSISGREL